MADPEQWLFSIHEQPERAMVTTATADGSAYVFAELGDVDGRLMLTRVEFRAEDVGITSSTLRALRVDALVGRARGEIAEWQRRQQGQPEPGGPGVDAMGVAAVTEFRASLAVLAKAAAKGKAEGRRGYGDAFFRLVALEYVSLTDAGQGGRGSLHRLGVVMAERMDERQPRPRDNIRDWVAEARRRGFLMPGDRGRGGARPGPRLFEEES